MSTPGAGSVLDASALLAYVLNEPGARRVLAALRSGAAISAANWAEVLSRLADLGLDPAAESAHLRGLLGDDLTIVPLDAAHGEEMARLRPLTRQAGLSLGDRACIALGRTTGAPVLTADRSWGAQALGVRVDVVR